MNATILVALLAVIVVLSGAWLLQPDGGPTPPAGEDGALATIQDELDGLAPQDDLVALEELLLEQ